MPKWPPLCRRTPRGDRRQPRDPAQRPRTWSVDRPVGPHPLPVRIKADAAHLGRPRASRASFSRTNQPRPWPPVLPPLCGLPHRITGRHRPARLPSPTARPGVAPRRGGTPSRRRRRRLPTRDTLPPTTHHSRRIPCTARCGYSATKRFMLLFWTVHVKVNDGRHHSSAAPSCNSNVHPCRTPPLRGPAPWAVSQRWIVSARLRHPSHRNRTSVSASVWPLVSGRAVSMRRTGTGVL